MTIFESMLNNTCERWCSTSTTNDIGEEEYTYTLHTDNIKCRLSPISLKESKDLAGINIDARYKCYLLPGQDVSSQDRIKCNGITYEITEVKVDSESMTKRLLLKEL